MGFPHKLLNPGEEVVVDVRPHWKYLFGPAFTVVVALAGSIAALVAQVPHWAELVLAGVLVLCLLWLAGRYARWTTTSFVVTNDRLILRKGVFGRSGREILIDRLTDISCNQSLFDRILRCGDVLLESPGRDSPEVFPDLPRPLLIQNEIYRLIQQRRSGSWGGTGDWVPGMAGMRPPAGAVPATGAAPAGATVGGTSGGATVGAGTLAGGTVGQVPMDATAGAGPGPAGSFGDPPRGGEPTVAEQLSQLDELRRRKVISRREFAAKKAELLSRM